MNKYVLIARVLLIIGHVADAAVCQTPHERICKFVIVLAAFSLLALYLCGHEKTDD